MAGVVGVVVGVSGASRHAQPSGVIVVVEGIVGTLGNALQVVAVVAERTVFYAGSVYALSEVACVAPSRAVPGDIVGEEARLAGIDAQAGRVVPVLQSRAGGHTFEIDDVSVGSIGHHGTAHHAFS